MKKTLTVNLGGTVFNIDEDAYRLLDNYLNNVRQHFRREPGADEIADDIERRISELLTEKLSDGRQVITLADTEEVIARVGKPEEMEQEADEEMGEPYRQPTSDIPRKRLFRNPDDKILGGVCGGLAAYLGADVRLLRLAVVLLAIFSKAILLPVYIVCWIVIPEARTAAEKLSMHGERVTLENIGRTVTDGFERVSNGVNNYVNSSKPRTFLQKLGDCIVSVAGWIFKAVLMILAIVSIPALLLCAVAFVILLFAGIVLLVNGTADVLAYFPHHFLLPAMPLLSIAMYIAGTLTVSIPLIAIVWSFLHYAFDWHPMNSGLKWTLLALWIVSTAGFIVCLVIHSVNW